MQTIAIDAYGTEIAYPDTGVPTSGGVYTTIFALHGMVFTSPVLSKAMELAHARGLRFVAITRCGYPGSTTLSTTDTAKKEYIQARGVELASFIDHFAVQQELPPVSEDGTAGGFTILVWSFGNMFALSVAANVDVLPLDAQRRLGEHLRALVLYDTPMSAVGTSVPPKTWLPQLDESIPPELQFPYLAQWLTGYFPYGDLSTRDVDALAYALSSSTHTPSIFKMSAEDQTSIIHEHGAANSDFPVLSLVPQANASCKKACYNAHVRELLPRMKTTAIVGAMSPSFCVSAFWNMEKDDEEHGGGFARFQTVPGINHSVHWDDPDRALKLFSDAVFAQSKM